MDGWVIFVLPFKVVLHWTLLLLEDTSEAPIRILPCTLYLILRDVVEFLLNNGASLLVHDSVTKRTPLHASGRHL